MDRNLRNNQLCDATYRTNDRIVTAFDRNFTTFSFYWRFLSVIFKASAKARRKAYSDAHWRQSSMEILHALERVGVCFEITGLEHLKQLDTPCVVVANHMSVLETTILPMIIVPYKKVTFIVKDSLMDYPVFKHILRSRHPIVVGRANARQDLKTVIQEGTERLLKGISVVVFPQTTRTRFFDPRKFNSMGVKLAGRAKVPVIPLALLTDAWGNGKLIKEFGKIHKNRKVHFAFGKPLWVEGRGTEVHQKIIAFIGQNLHQWRMG
jgi:1-acyl-sn-glycerol-3-phosphate acyltransferase